MVLKAEILAMLEPLWGISYAFLRLMREIQIQETMIIGYKLTLYCVQGLPRHMSISLDGNSVKLIREKKEQTKTKICYLLFKPLYLIQWP